MWVRDKTKETNMEILIPLPQSSSVNTYKGLNGYLKQLELAIHHAQKSVESAEKSGLELTDDTFTSFEHSILESSLKIDGETEGDSTLKNFMDCYWEDLQHIELKINLA